MAYRPYKAAYDASIKRLGEKERPEEGHVSVDGADSERLATKQMERHLLGPDRPQSLADQLHELKAMLFEIALQQQTGRVPSFLTKHVTASTSMPLEEEHEAAHAATHEAFQHVQQQGDAGKHAKRFAL